MFDSFLSNKNKDFSPGTYQFVQYVKDLYDEDVFKFKGKNLDEIVKDYNKVDKGIINLAKSIQAGEGKIEDLDKALEAGSTGAMSFSASLKTAVRNIGIMLAVSLAIKGAMALWDRANVTVAETKQRYDELSSSLSELQSEYDILNSRDYDSLSSSEKDRLEYLKERIDLEQQLLDIQQHKIYKEELGGGFTDYFDKDSYTYKLNQTDQYMQSGYVEGSTETFADKIERELNSRERILDDIKEYQDILTRTESELIGDKLSSSKQSLEDNDSSLMQYWEDAQVTLADYQSEYEHLQEMIDSGTLTASELKQAKEIQDSYQTRIDNVQKYLNTLSNALNTAPDTLTALDERLSNFTADDLKSKFSSDELELLLTATFDEDATLEELKELIDKLQAEANKTPIKEEVAFSDKINNVNNKISELSTLQQTYDSIKNKEFDLTSLTTGNFVEVFGKYTNEFEKFIQTVTDAPNDIKACQSAFDDLASAWLTNSGILDDLSNETADYTTKLLEENGIANAGEIVQTQLNVLNSLDNSNFVNTFKDTEEEYQNFINTISSTPGDINACQSAYYDLVKTWADSTGVLDDLTEANRNEKVALLESKGVANATWVVNRVLAQSYADQGFEAGLAGASTDEYANKIKGLGLSAQETQLYIYQLQLAEIAANNQKLDFTEQITECNKLAVAAGQAAAMLDIAQSQRSIAQQVQAEGLSWTEAVASGRVSQIQDQFILNNVTSLQDKIAKTVIQSVDSSSYAGSPKGGSGGGSKTEAYKAEIDALRDYIDAYEKAQAKREAIDKKYDNADTTAEKIALMKDRTDAMNEEQKAIIALNEARDKEIQKNVEALKSQGFIVSYDPSLDELQIDNIEHLNELKGANQEKTNDLIKKYEEMINTTEDMADENKELAVTWQDNIYTLKDYEKELEELKEELYNEDLTDIEFNIDAAETLGNFNKQIEYLYASITRSVNELNDAYNRGLDNTSDYVQEIIKNLFEVAEQIKEIRLSYLEDKRDDYDSAKNAVISVIDDNIEALEKEKEALEKVNDEQDRAIELSQLQEALDKAKSQKTIHVYRKGQGWVYESDQDAIRDAEQNLADFENEERINAIDEEIEKWEEYKDQWESVTDKAQEEMDKLKAAQLLGADWMEKVNDMQIGFMEDFGNEYYDICMQIQDITEQTVQDILGLWGVDTSKLFGNATKKKLVNVYYANEDGTAPSQAQIGDKIITNDGVYQIVSPDTKGDNVKYNEETGRYSIKVSDSNGIVVSKDNAGQLAYTDYIDVIDDRIVDLGLSMDKTTGSLGDNIYTTDNNTLSTKYNTDELRLNSDVIGDNTDELGNIPNYIEDGLKNGASFISDAIVGATADYLGDYVIGADGGTTQNSSSFDNSGNPIIINEDTYLKGLEDLANKVGKDSEVYKQAYDNYLSFFGKKGEKVSGINANPNIGYTSGTYYEDYQKYLDSYNAEYIGTINGKKFYRFVDAHGHTTAANEDYFKTDYVISRPQGYTDRDRAESTLSKAEEIGYIEDLKESYPTYYQRLLDIVNTPEGGSRKQTTKAREEAERTISEILSHKNGSSNAYGEYDETGNKTIGVSVNKNDEVVGKIYSNVAPSYSDIVDSIKDMPTMEDIYDSDIYKDIYSSVIDPNGYYYTEIDDPNNNVDSVRAYDSSYNRQYDELKISNEDVTDATKTNADRLKENSEAMKILTDEFGDGLADIVDAGNGVVQAVDSVGNILGTINTGNGSIYKGGSSNSGTSLGSSGSSLVGSTIGSIIGGLVGGSIGSAVGGVIGGVTGNSLNKNSNKANSVNEYKNLSSSDKSDIANKINGSYTVKVQKHAKGTGFVKTPHDALVDDDGSELLYRNGRLTHLEYGDKVFPHAESEAIMDTYKTLANNDNIVPVSLNDLVSSLGGNPSKISSLIASNLTSTDLFSDIIRNKPKTSSFDISNQYYLSGDIVLPNVKNYDDFKAAIAKELSTMPQKASQRSHNRIK